MTDSTAKDVPDVKLPIASAARTREWVWAELAARRGAAGATVAAGLVAAASAVLPAYLMGTLVDDVLARSSTSVLVMFTVWMSLAAIVGGIATAVSKYAISRLGETMLADLREATVRQALALPIGTIEQVGTSDLVSRIGADAEKVGKTATDVMPQIISALLLGAVSLVAIIQMDWRLGLAGALAIPAYVAALRWYLPRSAPRYAQERVAIADRGQVLVESLEGARTVHAFGRQAAQVSAIEVASARARDISIDVFAFFTRFVGRVNRAEFIGLAAILSAGFWLVDINAITVGETTAAALMFHRLFNPIGQLMFTFDDAQAAAASLARLVGVIDIDLADTRPAQPEAEPVDAELDLRNIEFSYDGSNPVLHGVSVRLAPGERVALVGSTGAGKSTLAAIAAGIYSPSAGTARIGGVPVGRLTAEQLADQISLVSQEVHVFAGPLIDDLRLARPAATDEQVADALRISGAAEWVQALDEGADTVVGAGGHDLTPTQSQQLALARLVLRDPRVAILDEATAEAGSLGARVLEESALASTHGRTTLVVAHRLTQAAAADRVVVLDAGRIVENGSHAELLDRNGVYARLWQAWKARSGADISVARAESEVLS